MPRFPDYDAETGQGLQFPVAEPSEGPPEPAAYQASIARQNAFDDEERFNQRRLQRQAEFDEAAGVMPPGATGFAAGIMQSTQKGDSALLAALAPANRPAFATRLAADREALLGQAAAIERQGRSRYEAEQLDGAFAAHEQDVARDPSLLATARQAYFGLVDSSGEAPARKAQRRQDAERGFAIAAWRGRFADDPEGGAAALGQDDAAGGAPGDPAFAAIPKAEHGGLISDAFLRRDQNQALARGTLDPTLRDAETALTSIGRYDGALPDETRFVAAYGREDGPRRHAEFQRIVKLGADVDAIKTMTPDEQTARLARFTLQANGPDLAEGRERRARASQAIALNLAARSKNPNAYVRAVYPALDRLWSEAESSPERLKAALSATNAAMDGLGLPAQGRAMLPKAMIDRALMRFGDTTKPLSERIAPFRALVTTPGDPAQQASLFAQAMQLGLPRLAAPALAAYGRGEDDRAARLLAAAFGDQAAQPVAGAKPGQPAAPAAPTSPLALRGSADAAGTNPAWRPVRTDTTIDLAPAMTDEFARLRGAGAGGLDPLTAMLYDRLVQRNLSLNGGDLANARALADQDIRPPGPALYAQIQPKTLTDASPGGGSANDNGGAYTPKPATATPAKPPFEMPEGPGKPANVNGSSIVTTSPGATIDNVPEVPKLSVKSAPGAPHPQQARSSALPRMRGADFAKGAARESKALLGLLLEAFNGATDVSDSYPGTIIPRTYVLPAFGGVRVSPEATRFLLIGLEKWADRPEQERRQDQADRLQRFNIAVSDALRRTAGPPRGHELVSNDFYDFIIVPGTGPDEAGTIVAVREPGREPSWFSRWFGDEGTPPGPWFGTPPPESESTPATEPKPGAVPPGSQGTPDIPPPQQQGASPLGTFGIFPAPAQPPDLNSPASGEDGENGPEPLVEPLPASGPNQPFDPGDYYAARKAGLNRRQALATAINNYRNHDGGSEIFNVNDTNSNLDKNKTRTLNNPDFQPPPSSTDEPYDRRDYDRLTREGHSGEVAYEASKELFQQRKRGIFPSISPGNEEGTSNFSADQDRPTKRGKGVTSPQIPKLKDRPHPPGMSRTDFGDKVLKWRGSPDEILRRRSEINASEIERMKAAGTTKSMIESWFNIYQNDFSRNNNNYVALTRMKLMQTILNYWED